MAFDSTLSLYIIICTSFGCAADLLFGANGEVGAGGSNDSLEEQLAAADARESELLIRIAALTAQVEHLQAVCTIDGAWSEWGAYGACSETCGVGKQIRKRECNNPKPVNGGMYCPGDRLEIVLCNMKNCPGVAKTAVHDSKTYSWLTTLHTADDAHDACQTAVPGSIPTVPTTMAEFTFLRTVSTAGERLVDIRRCSNDTSAWCRRDPNGSYTTGFDASLIPWGYSQPDHLSEECVHIWAGDAHLKYSAFNNIGCSYSSFTVICEKENLLSDLIDWEARGACEQSCQIRGMVVEENQCNDIESTMSGECAANHLDTVSCDLESCIGISKTATFGNKNYAWLTARYSAFRARAACQMIFPGSIPVVPTSMAEMDFIKTTTPAGGWGLIDVRRCADEDSAWCQPDAYGLYTTRYNMGLINWGSGQPDYSAGIEACAHFYTDQNVFNDLRCQSAVFTVICREQ